MKKFGTPIGAAPGNASEKVGLAGVGTPAGVRNAPGGAGRAEGAGSAGAGLAPGGGGGGGGGPLKPLLLWVLVWLLLLPPPFFWPPFDWFELDELELLDDELDPGDVVVEGRVVAAVEVHDSETP